jgi:hypothetical protein
VHPSYTIPDDQTINFFDFYEIDEQEAEHALSLKNYRKEGTGNASIGFYLRS